MGQTTVRKGRGGNSTVSKSTFCGGFSTQIIVGIHTYIFHNRECDFFKYFFWGGQPSDGGDMSPGIYAHASDDMSCCYAFCKDSVRLTICLLRTPSCPSNL